MQKVSRSNNSIGKPHGQVIDPLGLILLGLYNIRKYFVRQSGLVVSKLNSRLKGRWFKSSLIQITRWKWGESHARIDSCTQFWFVVKAKHARKFCSNSYEIGLGEVEHTAQSRSFLQHSKYV